jgi:hypothetical protein
MEISYTLYQIILILGLIHYENFEKHSVDYIEINSFYDDNGNLVFDQLILWHNSHVVDWCMLKDSRIKTENGEKEWKKDPANNGINYYGEFRLQFAIGYDGNHYMNVIYGNNPKLYKIYYMFIDRTYLQYDSELADRQFLEKEKRIAIWNK